MKNFRCRLILRSFALFVILLVQAPAAFSYTGHQLEDMAASSLKTTAATTTTRDIITFEWTWLELNYFDETYPLTVDLVGSNFQAVKKVIYLLPGGGVNFKSSFFTPIDKNLAQYLRKNGYLVIGITPREDNVPKGLSSYAFMSGWDMPKHRDDIHKIITIIQNKLKLPYTILGHSFGAAYALDYAGAYPDGPEKVIALDIYSFGPADVFPDGYTSYMDTAAWLSSIYAGFIDAEEYADDTYSQIQSLMLISLIFPKIDSGVSRGGDPYPGDFTYESLLYYSLIYSAYLPGLITDPTGLPGEWPMLGGYAAGDYTFQPDPLDDQYSLHHSDICTLREASVKVGSGLVPCALYRDFFAVNAVNGDSEIQWSRIAKPVLWINTGLGYGGYTYGANLISSKVTVPAPIVDYGHLDILGSKTAPADVWDRYIKPFLN